MINWDVWIGITLGLIFTYFVMSYVVPAIILKKMIWEDKKKW